MIKKVEDWTFTEHQAHAKGYLTGAVIGFFIGIAVMNIIIISIHLSR